MKERRYSGVWWLPSAPDNKVSGTLTFSNQDGLCLAVAGPVNEVRRFAVEERVPLILGITAKSQPVTLEGCLRGRFTSSSGGVARGEYLPDRAYVGAHFPAVEELHFEKAVIGYSQLPNWTRFSRWHSQFRLESAGDTKTGTVSWNVPRDLIANTRRGTITLMPRVLGRFRPDEDAHVHRSLRIQIESREDLTFKTWYTHFLYPLNNMLTLATCTPNSIVDLFVTSRMHPIPGLTASVSLPIQVLFQQTYGDTPRARKLLTSDMLFTLKDVEDDFSKVLDRWLTISEELAVVSDLFFSAQYWRDMYIESHFLNIVQAAESYHRRQIRRWELREEEHQRRVESILGSAPDSHKRWLTEKLQHSNDLGLRQRLRHLLDITGPIVLPLINNKQSFIHKVVETRNALIHGETRPDRIVDLAELYWTTQAMSYIVQACFLQELGFPQDRLVEMFSRTRQYDFQKRA
ncbi:MAG: HEPN domain-containing protein [Candidatus Methylomirabilales bacterium]